MEIKKFEIEFVQRSKNLLEDYQGPWDMTNLINCTLGLIILPYENIKGKPSYSFWDADLGMIPNLPPFRLTIFEPIKNINNANITYYPKTLKVLLQKIRNGLAHQRIEPLNPDGKFAGIIIKNYFDVAQTHQDLEIHLSQQELKSFALFVADEYLK